MVNEEVVVVEETVLGVAGTSKARETRPSPSSKTSPRLVPLNLLLLPWLQPLTPSSSGTSRPPLSLSLHDALPIWLGLVSRALLVPAAPTAVPSTTTTSSLTITLLLFKGWLIWPVLDSA